MSRNLFITGTGTDVGKTFVSALMVKKLAQSGRRAGYFKAAMSGNRRRADGSLIPGDGEMCIRDSQGGRRCGPGDAEEEHRQEL